MAGKAFLIETEKGAVEFFLFVQEALWTGDIFCLMAIPAFNRFVFTLEFIAGE